MNLKSYLFDRLKERSTYLGVLAILTSIGVNVDPAVADAIVTLALALAGAVMASTPDQGFGADSDR